jgi:hypothetical protein
VRRDEWIPSPRSPEHPSRGVLELSTHPQLGEPPSRVACRPLAGVFVFFRSPLHRMELWKVAALRGMGTGGRLGITGAEDSWQHGGESDSVRVSPAGLPGWMVRKGQDN